MNDDVSNFRRGKIREYSSTPGRVQLPSWKTSRELEAPRSDVDNGSDVVDVGAVVDDNFQQNFVGRVKMCPTSIEVKFEFSRDHRAMLLHRLLTKEASALTATAAHVSISVAGIFREITTPYCAIRL